jgi:hypothetical protein
MLRLIGLAGDNASRENLIIRLEENDRSLDGAL